MSDDWPQIKARELFFSKVQQDASGCWLWTGCVGKRDGYGRFTRSGLSRLAHRAGYQLLRGEIPDGMVLDHLCRVRHCVNPDHLRVVTNRENLLAEGSQSSPKRNVEKQRCPQCGSDYERRKEDRFCRPCMNRWRREYRRLHPEAVIKNRVYAARYRQRLAGRTA